MWYVLFLGIMVLSIFCGTSLIIFRSFDNQNVESKNRIVKSSYFPGDSIHAFFTRSQLNLKLKLLSKTPPLKELTYGAMCYSIAIPERSDVVEYVCPICGEKTIYIEKNYSKDWFWISRVLEMELLDCRREVAKIDGLNIKLDESQFCKYCDPNVISPKLLLKINIYGETDTNIVEDITAFDLQLIQYFLNDKITYIENYNEEVPLINHIERIKQLLNLK